MAADKFENAARVMYKDETLRHFVPALWRIKLGLEEKFGVSLVIGVRKKKPLRN